MDTVNDTSQKSKVCRQYYMYEYTDLTAVEEHCEDMALKGWKLTSIRNSLEFEACDPCALRYSVEVLPEAGKSGNEINESCRAYIDLCAEAGWTFVSNHGDIYVFVTSDPDIPPVVTDTHEKVEAIRRSKHRTRRFETSMCVYFMLTATVQLIRALSFRASNPGQYTALLAVAAMLYAFGLGFLTILIIRTVTHRRWCRRADAALDAGEPIPYYGKSVLRRRTIVYWALIGLMLAAAIGAIMWVCARDGMILGGVLFVAVMGVLVFAMLRSAAFLEHE